MDSWTCINKIKNKQGKIIGYRLKNDATGDTRDLKSDLIKGMIELGYISVTNLTVDKNNRLIGRKASEHDTEFKVAAAVSEGTTNSAERKATVDVREGNAGNPATSASATTNLFSGDSVGNFEKKTITSQKNESLKSENIFCDMISKLSEPDEDIVEQLVHKATKIGAKVKCVGASSYFIRSGHSCVLAVNNKITDTLTYKLDSCLEKISDYDDNILVIGGESLTDMSYLFKDAKAKTIDFRYFSAKSIRCLSGAFKESRVEYLDVSELNVVNTEELGNPFIRSDIQDLYIGNLVKSMWIPSHCSLCYGYVIKVFEDAEMPTSRFAKDPVNSNLIPTDLIEHLKASDRHPKNITSQDNIFWSIVNQKDVHTDTIIKQLLDEAEKINANVIDLRKDGTFYFIWQDNSCVLAINSLAARGYPFGSPGFIPVNPEANILVVGGDSITRMQCWFSEVRAKIVDFSNFRAKHVKDMLGCFEFCIIEHLDLRCLNVDKLEDWGKIFENAVISELYPGNIKAKYWYLSSIEAEPITGPYPKHCSVYYDHVTDLDTGVKLT